MIFPKPFSTATQLRYAAALAFERAVFVALTLLALGFAFEWVQPLIGIAGLLVITNVEALLGLVIGLWLLACLVAGRWPRRPAGLTIPVVLWLAVLVASLLAASDYHLEGIKFLSRVVNGVLVGWATYDLARTPARLQSLARAMALAGVIVAALGLAEVAQIEPLVQWLAGFKQSPVYFGDFIRLSATLGYANIAAQVLALTLPLALAWALTVRNLLGRFLINLALLTGLSALVLTLSRAGLIGLLAGLGLMFGVSAGQRRRMIVVGSLRTIGLGFAVILVIFISNPLLITQRLTSEADKLGYIAVYQVPQNRTARTGETLTVPVKLTNAGAGTWYATRPPVFKLGYHLTGANGALVDFNGRQTPLPADVSPGQTIEVSAWLEAPHQPGEYLIEWDMVHETVTWFSWKGTPTALTHLAVVGEPKVDHKPLRPPSSSPTDRPIVTPAVGRLALWQTAWLMVIDRPLLGVGPDNFRWAYGRYAGVKEWSTDIHANSLYFEWLADTGILGLMAFLWLTWRLGRRMAEGATLKHSQENGLWIWWLALAASLSTWFVHGLFDYFYEFTPTYVAFWLVTGLALSAVDLMKQQGSHHANWV